jgi:hypothetical protein
MSNNRTHADQRRSAKNAHRQIQVRRERFAILIGCFCMLAAAILLATTTDFTGPWLPRVFSDKEMQSVDPAADRTGIVVEQGDEGRCELMKFTASTRSASRSPETRTELAPVDPRF